MKRFFHYEAAFEAYLHERGHCYVAVNETRRASLGDVTFKNLDFIVHGTSGARLLVDVKGRRFPSGPAEKPRRVWKSWCMREDVEGLVRWQELFGPGFRSLLVFAYHIQSWVEVEDEVPDLWEWRGNRYLLRAVAVDEYRQHMRVCSPRWQTVYLPGRVLREVARPFEEFVRHEVESGLEGCPF
jgi:hypothetical protein